MATSVDAAPAYEAEHVHEVYQEIASHFSSTRYKVCVALEPPDNNNEAHH